MRPLLSAHHHARLIARRFSAARFHYLRGRYHYRQLQHLCFIHQSGTGYSGRRSIRAGNDHQFRLCAARDQLQLQQPSLCLRSVPDAPAQSFGHRSWCKRADLYRIHSTGRRTPGRPVRQHGQCCGFASRDPAQRLRRERGFWRFCRDARSRGPIHHRAQEGRHHYVPGLCS